VTPEESIAGYPGPKELDQNEGGGGGGSENLGNCGADEGREDIHSDHRPDEGSC
jgi:hypothetical protein